MNKATLIESVRTELGGETSKKEATDAVDAVLNAISNGVRTEGVVQIVGFGSFKITERAARMGINPRTREPMPLAASKSVRFTPAAALKGSL